MELDVADVVAEALASPRPAAFRARVLERLVGVVGADSGIFLPMVDGRISGPPAFLNKDRFEHLAARFAARPARHAAFQHKHWRAAGIGRGAYVDVDTFSARERDRMPFFAEIVRPQRITSQLVLGLRLHGRRVGSVYLCRHGRGRGFRDRDAEPLRPIVPALALAHQALDAAPATGADSLAALTLRQREIARCVANGLGNAEIAVVLGCSPHTVRNHLSAIFDALGIHSRTRLALLASGSADGGREVDRDRSRP